LREFGGLDNCPSIILIQIPASVEIFDACSNCNSLREITFKEGNQLKVGNGIENYPFLKWTAFPSSAEVITSLSNCRAMQAIFFPSDSSIREICGFILELR
jgi:hypothetical protein